MARGCHCCCCYCCHIHITGQTRAKTKTIPICCTSSYRPEKIPPGEMRATLRISCRLELLPIFFAIFVQLAASIAGQDTVSILTDERAGLQIPSFFSRITLSGAGGNGPSIHRAQAVYFLDRSQFLYWKKPHNSFSPSPPSLSPQQVNAAGYRRVFAKQLKGVLT